MLALRFHNWELLGRWMFMSVVPLPCGNIPDSRDFSSFFYSWWKFFHMYTWGTDVTPYISVKESQAKFYPLYCRYSFMSVCLIGDLQKLGSLLIMYTSQSCWMNAWNFIYYAILFISFIKITGSIFYTSVKQMKRLCLPLKKTSSIAWDFRRNYLRLVLVYCWWNLTRV